jgi:acyl-coenzyme A thioesterase PaaI-like protein
METLNIKYVDAGEGFSNYACKPISPSANGTLHGGASVALAESVGSAASFYT